MKLCSKMQKKQEDLPAKTSRQTRLPAGRYVSQCCATNARSIDTCQQTKLLPAGRCLGQSYATNAGSTTKLSRKKNRQTRLPAMSDILLSGLRHKSAKKQRRRLTRDATLAAVRKEASSAVKEAARMKHANIHPLVRM